MTDDEIVAISDHFSRESRVADYSNSSNPMNDARRGLIRRMVVQAVPSSRRVLEIGCGIGTLTAELVAAGIACTGLDLSAEMIRQARRLVGEAATLEQVDLFAYEAPCRFDAVIANGVLPYYRDKARFLQRVADLTKTGGIAVIMHRNALFNLFALNRGTIDFVTEELLGALPQDVRKRVAVELEAIPGLATPVRRDASAELYRSAENPLTVADLYQVAGFSVREIRYCFMHGAPPRLPPLEGVPETGDLQLRYEQRWEGMFLGSQFVVLATRC
jgi:SAM-dependent methyltransferase